MIKMKNGKGLFENVLIYRNLQNKEQKFFCSYGYELNSKAKALLAKNKILENEIFTVSMLVKEAKKVLKELDINYSEMIREY